MLFTYLCLCIQLPRPLCVTLKFGQSFIYFTSSAPTVQQLCVEQNAFVLQINVPHHPVNFHMVALSAPVAHPIFLQLWPQFSKFKFNLVNHFQNLLQTTQERNEDINVGLDVRVVCDFHWNFPRYVAWHSCLQSQMMRCAAALPVRSSWCEAARCMLFRPSHIVSRSEPAVNTDTYIHMRRLHAGRYLFSPAKTHECSQAARGKEQNVCECMCIFSFTGLLSDSNRSASNFMDIIL